MIFEVYQHGRHVANMHVLANLMPRAGRDYVWIDHVCYQVRAVNVQRQQVIADEQPSRPTQAMKDRGCALFPSEPLPSQTI